MERVNPPMASDDRDRARQVATIAKDPELIEGLLGELSRYRAGDNRIADRIVGTLRAVATRWTYSGNAERAACGRDLVNLLDGLDPKGDRA